MALSNFDINDYQEKYRWTGKDNTGGTVQLRILYKTSTPFTLVAMRGLVDLQLQVQGAQGKVFDPVVKTSLVFSLVDAPDLSTPTEKAGDWQEFFTPDSTAYLVQLYRGANNVWQGFITPDSYEESLSYHGTVTITARDNIGHCYDIPFQDNGYTDGMATIRNLVETALDEVFFPMTLLEPADGADAQVLRDSHGYYLDSYVCVSEFEGETWGEVLEECLHSIGYTLRFVGNKSFSLAPIRNIPLGRTDKATALSWAQGIEFYGGTRSYDPAFKLIREKMDYGAQAEVALDILGSWLYGATTASTYTAQYLQYTGGGGSVLAGFTGRSWKNGNTDFSTKGGWSNTFGFLNPQVCSVDASLTDQDGAMALFQGVGLAAAQAVDGSISPLPTFRMPAPTTDVTLRLEFARPVMLTTGSSPYKVKPCTAYIKSIKLSIFYYEPGGQVWTCHFTDGIAQWGYGPNYTRWPFDVATEPATSYALDIALPPLPATATPGGWLDIEFANSIHYSTEDLGTIYGIFDIVTAIKATLNAKRILKSDTVTTVNNQDYNVLVERKPSFAPLSVSMPYFDAHNYPRALWAKDSDGKPVPMDYAGYFTGYDASKALPLPVQIHKQLLQYGYTPLQILEGSCGRTDKTQRMFLSRLCSYKGTDFVIQGGTLDVLHNRISGARLHGFAWYGDLWDEDNNPTYNVSPVQVNEATLNGANGNSSIKG